MRFKCLSDGCGKPFGWSAKKTVQKIVEGFDLPVTMEYVVCPYCERFDFEEYATRKDMTNYSKMLKDASKHKTVPPVKDFAPVNQFDQEDLMKHRWKGKKIGDREYAPAAESYGWDFTDQFLPATVDALNHSGTVAIGDREFELKGKIVAMKKVKQ